MVSASAGMAIRGAITIRKWGVGRDPERDPPDEIAIEVQWQEGGQVVTDPVRIAELEQLAAQQKDEG